MASPRRLLRSPASRWGRWSGRRRPRSRHLSRWSPSTTTARRLPSRSRSARRRGRRGAHPAPRRRGGNRHQRAPLAARSASLRRPRRAATPPGCRRARRGQAESPHSTVRCRRHVRCVVQEISSPEVGDLARDHGRGRRDTARRRPTPRQSLACVQRRAARKTTALSRRIIHALSRLPRRCGVVATANFLVTTHVCRWRWARRCQPPQGGELWCSCRGAGRCSVVEIYPAG